ITHGPLSARFRGVVVAGVLVPIALAGIAPALAPVAAVLALVGLAVYEDLWIRAGQTIPLS
ncbi:MAG TPA: 4Fe-4S ferredoxin, partial [Candidatus Tectomicrobia bacterium]|nr:4Fe-4S ferredoxin [Candidatus Tectomicrobia bacterium]